MPQQRARSVSNYFENVELLVREFRGRKVIMDSDLARLYGVPTKAFNQAVKRNAERFPDDFMFRLTWEEAEELRGSASRSQNVTLNSRNDPQKKMRSQIVTASKRNERYLPYVFTEHGAVMAANVLKSAKAIEMSVFVVRAFVRMREMLNSRKELARQLAELDKKLTGRLDVHESAIADVLQRIMLLLDPPPPPPSAPRREIGFHAR